MEVTLSRDSGKLVTLREATYIVQSHVLKFLQCICYCSTEEESLLAFWELFEYPSEL